MARIKRRGRAEPHRPVRAGYGLTAAASAAFGRGLRGDRGLQLRPRRGLRLVAIEHERRGADAAQILDQRAAVVAGLEMPLDAALFGAVETPVDQVDEGISLRSAQFISAFG